MLIFFSITVVVLLGYGILIGYYFYSWIHLRTFNRNETAGIKHNTKVTVIIPARNEESTITRCLTSLSRQTYPEHLLEIIVVNDHSTDNTSEMVERYQANNVRLINLADFTGGKLLNSYKKKAIEVAIAESTGDFIITTDADCTALPGWIKCLMDYRYLSKAVLLAAPVKIENSDTVLSIFQSIDFLTLQGITGASVSSKFHSMCNGANLGYEKTVFNEVDGFKGIDSIASGDDMLLMHKIVSRYPSQFVFVKEEDAIVTTDAASSWRAFLNQRIRWASKADKYNDKRIIAVLSIVYFLNVFILVFLFSGLWNIHNLVYFIVLVVLKTAVEFLFVRKVSLFFNQQHLMVYFPLLQLLHIIYTIIAGWLGKFGTYEWKSRRVK